MPIQAPGGSPGMRAAGSLMSGATDTEPIENYQHDAWAGSITGSAADGLSPKDIYDIATGKAPGDPQAARE